MYVMGWPPCVLTEPVNISFYADAFQSIRRSDSIEIDICQLLCACAASLSFSTRSNKQTDPRVPEQKVVPNLSMQFPYHDNKLVVNKIERRHFTWHKVAKGEQCRSNAEYGKLCDKRFSLVFLSFRVMSFSAPSSPLAAAFCDHWQATIQLVRVALELEWTILTRFLVAVTVATFIWFVYLMLTLRHSRRPLEVWESLNTPVIKLFRPRIFAFLNSKANPYTGSTGTACILSHWFTMKTYIMLLLRRHDGLNVFKRILHWDHASSIPTKASYANVGI